MDGVSDAVAALNSAYEVQMAASLKALKLANSQQGDVALRLLESAVELAQGPPEEGKGLSFDSRG